jgi:hypothetical protein
MQTLLLVNPNAKGKKKEAGLRLDFIVNFHVIYIGRLRHTAKRDKIKAE